MFPNRPANTSSERDHGGGLDAAMARHGGTRAGWIDLSTGINPVPYPLPDLSGSDWTALPDRNAHAALVTAARRFWRVPDGAAILPAPGASALIARLPALLPPGRVGITPPTYNEHAAAFAASGWAIKDGGQADARVLVHPNNPDGRLWTPKDADADLTIIDESFCDVMPEASLIQLAGQPGRLVLKSFGKFWGLAGLRLGFAIARQDTIGRLADMLGPWPVSGPALRIGAAALSDTAWADRTRTRLRDDAARLDAMITAAGAAPAGGTDLFRLYRVDDAARWQDRLAQRHIWSRRFPYSSTLLRLGLPGPNGWIRLRDAL
ncbi:pyridoxal phosphate-dependent class II aminotransferase [Sedimentitalea sp. JM2-8]|uniref:Aminotransferase n=1 Tax=Sedimentitalea xiamensis TaxID=3050037 RepID=A0ABT7FAD1_9RHOB|nr:threonine-phosphate decarboxylase [Sedimentitalea xiamensis]MDK3072070.1 pyridoxal phosphate-dependent class II aminotransferase [Sedimentitalea xiamensis]